MKHFKVLGLWVNGACSSLSTAAAFASMGDIAWERVYIAACLWACVLVVVGLISYLIATASK